MENNQELLEAIQTSDPLWISPDIESNVSKTDLAQEHCGPEPTNMEEFLQTEEHMQEFLQTETSNMEKLEEEIGIDPLNFLELTWNSENSENSSENSENSSENSENSNNSYDMDSDISDEEIYMSPVNLSADTESNDGSSSSSNMDSDTSDEDDVVVEDDQEDERHRRQMVDTITA